jgi:hypothetical protein
MALSNSAKRIAPALVEVPIASGRGGPTDPSHDEQLRKGIIHTVVTRRVAWLMVGVFLLLTYAVPIGQLALETVRDEESVLAGMFRELPTKERLARLEDDLEESSYAKEFVQPRLQLWLSKLGREGNEKAVIGRTGYLFYKPGITFLASPGFLNPDLMALRERAAKDAGEAEVVADPRPAIFAFHAMLKSRGIELVLFPVPDKAMLQPRELHGRVGNDRGTPVARSRDWPRLADELRQRGVRIFDPTPATLDPQAEPRFLVQDTHWTPAWMQSVAAELAAFVQKHARLSKPATDPGFVRRPIRVSRVGDLVDMLKLPEDQSHFLPQEVNLLEVVDRNGEPFASSEESEILLLGDSFTNVFTEEFMGWGSAAGFAPQLAVELGRPLEVIAQNDSGAYATRAALALGLEQGTLALDGKKVVIWEFAARELAVGNWKHIDWSKVERAKGAP